VVETSLKMESVFVEENERPTIVMKAIEEAN